MIVGGGAAGLELATKLGDRLGRNKKAAVTLVDAARIPYLETSSARGGGRQHGCRHHAVDYLAQAHRHHFRYRGRRDGRPRRDRKRCILRPASTMKAARSLPPRSFRYDTLVMAVGSGSNDFGTPGVKEHAIALDTPDQAVRFHQRLSEQSHQGARAAGPVRPGQLHVASSRRRR